MVSIPSTDLIAYVNINVFKAVDLNLFDSKAPIVQNHIQYTPLSLLILIYGYSKK